MIARYLVLPNVLLELVLAASNCLSNSSIPVSTNTLEITSFLTVTAPPHVGTGYQDANGSGLDYASSCNEAKLEWIESRGQTNVSKSTFVTSTSSVSYTVIRSGWIETIGPTEIYTLCDGYPRMNASTDYKTLDTTPQQTAWKTFTTETEVYRNETAPTCKIGPRECSALESEYSTSLVAYSNYNNQYYSTWTGATSYPSAAYPSSPICGSVTLPPKASMTLAPAACMYNYATIQLLYWPVSTVGNHICGDDWTTVEATPTIPGQPNTAVALNTTFTSPTVYMVMSGAYEIGSNFETGTAVNGILPMMSDRVSSMCAQQGGSMGPPEPMDYADFDAPIPASKYRCQPACWTKPDYPQSWQNPAYNITATENLCSTIHDRVYKPALQVPIKEFNSFYSQYTNGVGLEFGDLQCSFNPAPDGIFYDPPSALQQVQSAVRPTTPGSPGATTTPVGYPQTTPASPGSTVPTALLQTKDGGDGVGQPTQPTLPIPSGGNDNYGDPPETGTPSDPEINGGSNDDPADAESPSDEGNSGNNGGNHGGTNEGNNSGGDADTGPHSDPTPTQDVGGVIASIIGANPSPSAGGQGPEDGHDPSDSSSPSDPSESSGSATSDNNSGSLSIDGSHTGADQPGVAPGEGILLTDTSGQTVTAIRSGDNLVLSAATIAVGQDTSVDGVGSISVGSEGVEQNGQTIGYQTVAPSPSDAAGNDVYVVDGQTYAADSSSNVVVAPDVTLTAGGAAATVSGTTYSLSASSDGNDGGLIVNGVTASASGGGSATVSGGRPQQTRNAAPGFGAHSLHSSVALGLLALLGLI